MYDSSPMPNKILYAVLISLALCPSICAQKRPIPPPTLLQIVKAEDERRWDDQLRQLLSDRNPSVRNRAALAAGRIGNEDAVAALTPLLEKDADVSVRAMAAFALGEIESGNCRKRANGSLEKHKRSSLKSAHARWKRWAKSPLRCRANRKRDNASSARPSSEH